MEKQNKNCKPLPKAFQKIFPKLKAQRGRAKISTEDNKNSTTCIVL